MRSDCSRLYAFLRANMACSRLRPTHRAACLVLLAITSSVAHAQPTFRTLGVLPGGSYSRSAAISADGQTVVGRMFYSGSNYRAFHWNQADGMRDIGMNVRASPTAVSADGAQVALTVEPPQLRSHRWSMRDGLRSLGLPPGGSYTISGGISANGEVLVGQSASAAGVVRAYRWTAASGFHLLGVLPDMTSSGASGASGDGAVIVGVSCNSSGSVCRGFRWTAAGGMQDIGTRPSATTSSPTFVSTDGRTIVGWSGVNGSLPTYRAFRWTSKSGVQDLGTLPGDLASTAMSCTADGSAVVGWSGNPQLATDAFIWTPANGMVELRSYLAAAGLDMTNVPNLVEAVGISADGTAITGTGGVGSGSSAWIVTGLPPTTALCSCDWDYSRELTSQDFFDFLSDYFDGRADFNESGQTDDADVFDFMTCFMGGCGR